MVGRKIVLVDMDNTIVDYSSEMAKQLRLVYNDNGITADNWDSLPYSDLSARRREIQSEDGFFLRLPPIEGAIAALKEMESTSKYDIFIVSSPTIRGGTCHSDKCKWLLQHLGMSFARNLVLTKDKTLVHGDVLIDDKPIVSGVVTDMSWRLVTFAQPYNAGIDGRVYLSDWRDWQQVIESVLD
jgi:5'-nucleotidase